MKEEEGEEKEEEETEEEEEELEEKETEKEKEEVEEEVCMTIYTSLHNYVCVVLHTCVYAGLDSFFQSRQQTYVPEQFMTIQQVPLITLLLENIQVTIIISLQAVMMKLAFLWMI